MLLVHLRMIFTNIAHHLGHFFKLSLLETVLLVLQMRTKSVMDKLYTLFNLFCLQNQHLYRVYRAHAITMFVRS